MFPLKTKDAFTAHLQRPNDVQANASAFSARWQFNNDMSVLLVQLLLVVLADGSLELVQSVVLGDVLWYREGRLKRNCEIL